MRAICIRHYGGPEVLELVDTPQPVPVSGQVLIRVEAAAVNPADGKWRDGMFARIMPDALPMIPGYDIAGIVTKTCPNGPPAGTRVAAMLDPVSKGGYAEFAVAPIDALAIIPDTLGLDQAAAAPTAGLTGLQIAERVANVQPGQTILVTGALGMVGRIALHYASKRGAKVVAAVRQESGQAARDAGADAVIVLDENPPADMLFDHVLDTVGGPDVANLCRQLQTGGSIVTVATTPIEGPDLPAEPQFYGVENNGTDLTRILADMAKGELVIPVELTLPLEQAATAQSMVDAGKREGKIILLPQRPA